MAFPTYDYYYGEEDTDSETSSDSGQEDVGGPDTTRMSEQEAASVIYMAYRRAKRVWRRFTGKPVRKFRRSFRRHHHQQSKGKGRGRGFFWTQDDVVAYLKGQR